MAGIFYDVAALIQDNVRVLKSNLRSMFSIIDTQLYLLNNRLEAVEDPNLAYDKLGALGVATTATVGTTTVYTVPANRGAIGQLEFFGVAGAASTFKITVNGVDVFTTGALTTGTIIYSTRKQMYNTVAAATALTGSNDDLTVAPAPARYGLQAAQTVTYTIGTTAFTSVSVQFTGGEKINV